MIEYTVHGIDDSGNEEWYVSDLSKAEAGKEAMHRRTNTYRVFVTFARHSDGQKGYLNPDGHSPVGRTW